MPKALWDCWDSLGSSFFPGVMAKPPNPKPLLVPGPPLFQFMMSPIYLLTGEKTN